MAITCDIKPSEDIRQAAKFNFKLRKGGIPQLMNANGKLSESSELANSNLQYLAKQSKIGWDFYGTLIGGAAHKIFAKFIKDHPHIEHYIITTTPDFGWLRKDLTPILAKFDLSPKLFTKIIGFDVRRGQRDLKYLQYEKLMVCKEFEIPVLVDDDTDRKKTVFSLVLNTLTLKIAFLWKNLNNYLLSG